MKKLFNENYMVFDTEGLGLNDTKKKKYGKQQSYHIGYGIFNPYGELLKSGNFIVREIFENEEKMNTAFYRNKLDMYYQDLQDKVATLRYYKNIINQIKKDIKEYNIKAVFAYNCPYDLVAILETAQATELKNCPKLTFKENAKGKPVPQFEQAFKEILENEEIEVFDIMTMSCMSICQDKEYLETVEYSPKGNPRTTAEAVYRYVSGNSNFVEEHTAYEDSIIENEILKECFKRGLQPQKFVYMPFRLIPKKLYKKVA